MSTQERAWRQIRAEMTICLPEPLLSDQRGRDEDSGDCWASDRDRARYHRKAKRDWQRYKAERLPGESETEWRHRKKRERVSKSFAAAHAVAVAFAGVPDAAR